MARSAESRARLAERMGQYPPDWKAISTAIRSRSGGQCECQGECGLHCQTSRRRCIEREGAPAIWAKGHVMLTVHHLDHDPKNNAPGNLRAMCQRCHLRCDMEHHQRNAAETRRAKKRVVELVFFEVTAGGA